MSPGTFATFDGTGGLQIANGTEPTNIDAQDFAVSFWIRLPDASKLCYRCPIVGQRFGCDDETHWVVWFRGQTFYQLRFEMWDAAESSLQNLDVNLDATLKDTRWHFIIAFREGTTLNIAVDGKVAIEKKTYASVANLAQPRRPLAIGYWGESCAGVGKHFFSGQMADVRLFVRKLPLCNATDTTSASQTSVASTSTQTAAPTSVATQTPVGSTSVVPTQTTAPVSDASTTGATNTTQTTAPATDASITGATNTTQQTTTAANSASAQVSPTPTEPDSQIGAIVGGVVAALVLVAIVFGVFLFQRRRRGDNANTKSETSKTHYGSVLTALQ